MRPAAVFLLAGSFAFPALCSAEEVTLPGLEHILDAKPAKKPAPPPEEPAPEPAPAPKKKWKKPPKRPEAAPRTRTGRKPTRSRYFIERRSPDWYFLAPRRWLGPEDVPGGERFTEPKNQAFFEIVFHTRGSEGWVAPPEYRKHMRSLGSIEDSHSLDTVMLSGRFASRVRFTTHYYPAAELIGRKETVFYTEEILVPDPDGIYVIRYRALKGFFQRHRHAYLSFLGSLKLPSRPMLVERYYLQRDHILEDPLEEVVDVDASPHIEPPLILSDKRFRGGLILGAPAGAGLFGSAALTDHTSLGVYFGSMMFGMNAGGTDYKDVKLLTIGGRLKLHYPHSMRSGAFLFTDLAYVTASFKSLLDDERIVELDDKSSFISFGLGWQFLFRKWAMDLGYGIVSGGSFKKKSENATKTAEKSLKVKSNLFLSATYRF